MNGHLALADRLSGAALAAIGTINAFFALSFLTILAIAAQSLPAHSAGACDGENIIAELERSDPAALAALQAEAAATPNGKTIFYRVENAAGDPSWLFGTIHMTDPRVLNLPDPVRSAFEAAEVVAIETTDILDPDKTAEAMFSRPELTMFTDGTRISDFLTETEREMVKQGLADRGIQMPLVERMKPWLLVAMVALPECEMERKNAGGEILDADLAREAQEAGKELIGLETMVEQLDAMASLPLDFHVRGLVDTIALGDRMADVNETMIELYEDGQIGMIFPMLRHVSEQTGLDGGLETHMAEFEEKLINIRNDNMLQRSRALIDKGNAFIAVGALHLPGDKGLVSLFTEAGYKVTAGN